MGYGRATTEGRLVLIDAEHVLNSITVDGGISVDTFASTLAPLLTPGPTRRIYGEVVSLLVQRGDVEGALAIEALGHELARELQLRVWCGYTLSGGRPLTSDDVSRVENVHTRSFFEDGQKVEAPQDHSPVHAVRFYENQDALARLVGRFIGEGFVSGLPAIVIATPDHRQAIRNALSQHYFDVDRLQQAGDLIMIDARDTLRSFMVDGMPDPVRFRNQLVRSLNRPAGEGKNASSAPTAKWSMCCGRRGKLLPQFASRRCGTNSPRRTRLRFSAAIRWATSTRAPHERTSAGSIRTSSRRRTRPQYCNSCRKIPTLLASHSE